MRNKNKMLFKIPMMLIFLSFLFVGNFNLYGQKSERLSVKEVKELIKKSPKLEISSKTNQAYTDLLYETFDGISVPEGWVLNNANSGDYEGWYIEGLAFHEDVELDCDDWLISPAITLGDAPVVLEFYEFTAYADYADFHGIFISTSPDMSDSTLVYSDISPDYEDQYTSIDLKDWANETIYLAFNYKGNWADIWVVDDVRVGMPGNEIVNMSIDQAIEDLKWDDYGRRIEGVISFVDQTDILPSIEVSSGASIVDNVKFDMPSKGDTLIEYTVTSSDNTEAIWQLYLMTESPSIDAEIEAFNIENIFQDEEGDDAVYFINDTAIIVAATADADLSAINVTELEVSMDATISPSAVSPTTTDFSDMPVVYTVTAQDTNVKVEYSVTIYKEETEAPVVSVADSTYVNYGDSVMVKYLDNSLVLGGGIALFHKDVDVAAELAGGTIDDVFDAKMAMGVDGSETGSMDSLFYISTTDLVPGIYYVWAADYFQNLSLQSTDSIVIVQDTVEVDAIADMEVLENVLYKYTGEALVQHTNSYRHRKWIKDESMAIMTYDYDEYIDDTVVRGDIITNLYGKVKDYEGLLEFVPDSTTKNMAEIVSRENEVIPVKISFKELMEDKDAYQNELVRLDNVMFTDGDGVTTFANGKNLDIVEATSGRSSIFRTDFYSVDYIGEIIPDTASDIIGIVGYKYDDIILTARDADDIIPVEGYEFSIDPEELDFELVGITEGTEGLTISNTGADKMTVEYIYIEGDNAFRVDLLEGIEIMGYNEYSFPVYFKPAEFGSYEATLFVKLSDGEVFEVALMGTSEDYPEKPVLSMPYFNDFESGEMPEYWTDNQNMYVNDWLNAYDGDYGIMSDDGFASAIITPQFNLADASFPTVSYYLSCAFGSDETVSVTIDGGDTWEIIRQESIPWIYSAYMKVEIALGDYIGEVIQLKFEKGVAGYLMYDNFSVKETPTTPIFSASAEYNFGAVDGTTEAYIDVKNEGISYYTVTDIKLTDGTGALTLDGALTEDVDVYDAERLGAIMFDGSLGLHKDTIEITYVDPRMGDSTVLIPVSATGVACSAPISAVVGSNTAPYAPSWFEFTPANSTLVTISTCGDYADTDIEVYEACDGILVAANDDMGDCWNPYASKVEFPAKAGVSYKINFVDTWEASGFEWTLSVEDLATAPELLSVETSAMNAQQGVAALTFKDMIELPLSSKSKVSVHSQVDFGKVNPRSLIKTDIETSVLAKTFVPDGDDEGEPNGDELTAKRITIGTIDNPTKITGKYGVQDDYDWFVFPQSEIGYYFDITLEVEAGVCDMFLVYWNEAEESWWGSKAGDITPDNPGSFSYTKYDSETDTVYIWVRRGAMAAVAEPGYGYNLKVWNSAPPVFSIYRDNFKIAGPESMTFSYVDKGIDLNKEYCYSVTQELNTGEESELSNSICVTAVAGLGDVCNKALPLEPGLNEAPRSPSWFVYTPKETTAVTLSSNIEENGDPVADRNDTWLFVYANCDDESPLYESDDVESGVIRTSHLEFVANAGQSYLINWRRWAAEGEVNAYDAEPFYFVLEEGDLIDGDYVENAIPVSLPLVDFAGTTDGFNHNYDAVTCDDIFMGGNDVCYTFDIPYGGTISGGITGEYVGMHVIKGSVGNESCIALATGSNGGTFANQAIMPGTYTIIISSQLPTEATDFVMNLAYTPDAKQTVTFNVDMGIQIATGAFDPANDVVDIVGTFNMWEHTDNLADADGDGVYTYALATEYFVGEKLRYKYRINGDWATAELSSDVNVYREWTVKSSGNATDDLFDDMQLPTYAVTFRAIMARQIELGNFITDGTNELGLTGSFYPTEIKPKDADGDFIYEFTAKNIEYGELDFVFNIDDVNESVGSRTAMITSDTVISVWYNNDNALNVGDNLASMVDVYPNPSTGKFAINFGTIAIEDVTIEVVNIEGRVVNVIDNVDSKIFSVDVSELGSGVYYLRINDGNTVGVEKIVIK